jgi:hypothetical protein
MNFEFYDAPFGVEDRGRNAKLSRRPDELIGPHIRDETGHWSIHATKYTKYLKGAIVVRFPHYIWSIRYTIDGSEPLTSGCIEIPAVPKDIVAHLIERTVSNSHWAALTPTDMDEIFADIAGAFECFGRAGIQAARKCYDPNVRFSMVFFEAFDGRTVTWPIDWAEVARKAGDALKLATEAGLDQRPDC